MNKMLLEQYPDGKHGIDKIDGRYCPWYRRSTDGTSYYYTTGNNAFRKSFDTQQDAHNWLDKQLRESSMKRLAWQLGLGK